jgi:PAS domain S-box-containing protein
MIQAPPENSPLENQAPENSHVPPFLAGYGELSNLIANFDWAKTPLGPISNWSGTLRSTIALILHSPVPIVTLWGDDGIMIYNDAYSDFAGDRHPELLGSKVREGWHEVADFNDNVMKVGLASGSLAYVDQELTLHRSGKPEQVWMNLDYSPIIGTDGCPEGVIAIVVETTAKVLAERRLREAAGALATLNEELEQRVAERTAERDRVWRYSRNLLAILAADGTILAVNPAWSSHLGYAEQELVGRPHLNFFADTENGAAQHLRGPLADRPNISGLETRLLHRDGSPRWISWNTHTAGDEIFAYGRDVTAEKEQAEALRRAEEQLRQSQKMEAIGQLTGGVAHDFNNLLTVISASAEFLARDNLSDERRHRYVSAITHCADRASKLTSQLLAFARRQTLLPEIFDLVTCIQELADITNAIVGTHVQLDIQARCDECFVEVDRGQLETAIVNMVVNARDAMDGHGRLEIQISATASLPEPLDGGSQDYVAISVADTGAGIAPEHVARIFEPFFTTKDVGKGTGLGLSQVYGFVKQSGGEIDVASGPSGTTFTIYLPRTKMGAAANQNNGSPRQGIFSGRMLVVEDNPEVGSFALELLHDLGYDVTLATSAEQAMETLEATDAAFDLVFSDVVMPGLGGIELADLIRRQWPGIPLILTSGYSHVLAADAHHGFELLHKPYSITDLSRAIERVLTKARES